MRPVVIVIVLPFPQLLIEQVNVVGDAVLVQELVELLVVNTMRALDLAIQVRASRLDVHVPNIQTLQVPVELRLKLSAVVRLHHVDAERQPVPDVVDESDGGALVARVVDLQHANPGAIVNGGELIEPLAGAGDPLEELHVQLESVAWQRFLISLPPLAMGPMLLVGWKSVHPVTTENPVHGRPGHGDLMESL
jgi:hypothetical protein